MATMKATRKPRINHNRNEQKRRRNLRDSMADLRVFVPGLEGDPRESSINILQGAASYIHSLRRRSDSLAAQADELRRQNQTLRYQLDDLRRLKARQQAAPDTRASPPPYADATVRAPPAYPAVPPPQYSEAISQRAVTAAKAHMPLHARTPHMLLPPPPRDPSTPDSASPPSYPNPQQRLMAVLPPPPSYDAHHGALDGAESGRGRGRTRNPVPQQQPYMVVRAQPHIPGLPHTERLVGMRTRFVAQPPSYAGVRIAPAPPPYEAPVPGVPALRPRAQVAVPELRLPPYPNYAEWARDHETPTHDDTLET